MGRLGPHIENAVVHRPEKHLVYSLEYTWFTFLKKSGQYFETVWVQALKFVYTFAFTTWLVQELLANLVSPFIAGDQTYINIRQVLRDIDLIMLTNRYYLAFS